MRLLKQSTARNLLVFMTDSADHVTGKAGLTLTIKASKDGGAFATITPTVTELESGWYSLALTTTHTNTLGDLALHVTASGADPSDLVAQVVLELPGVVASIANNAITSAAINDGAITNAKVADGLISAAKIAADAITDAKVAADVTIASVTGAVGSVTGNVGGNVTGSVGSVTGLTASDVAAIKGKTDNLPSDPADQSLIIAATDALVTLANGIKAKTDNLPNAAIVHTGGKLWALDGDGNAVAPASATTAIKGVTDKLDDTLEDDSGTYRFTENALEQAPAGGGGGGGDCPTAEENAAAVWGAATRVLTAGTNIVLAKGTGVTGLTDLDAAGVRGAVGLGSANLDTQLSAINGKTTNLPSDPADASDIAAAFSAVNGTLSTLGINIGTILAAVDTEVAAIKAKTDNLPGSPASATDVSNAVTAILNTALAESYAAEGATFTLRQALYMIVALLANRRRSADVLEVLGIDGETVKMTFALDASSGPPTEQVRAT